MNNPKRSRTRQYVGVHNDMYGGMTPTGQLFRDAWVFGLLPETETGEGWDVSRVQQLHDQVAAEWDKYGLRVSNLPPELRERHERLYSEAIERARELGWVAGADIDREMGDDA